MLILGQPCKPRFHTSAERTGRSHLWQFTFEQFSRWWWHPHLSTRYTVHTPHTVGIGCIPLGNLNLWAHFSPLTIHTLWRGESRIFRYIEFVPRLRLMLDFYTFARSGRGSRDTFSSQSSASTPSSSQTMQQVNLRKNNGKWLAVNSAVVRIWIRCFFACFHRIRNRILPVTTDVWANYFNQNLQIQVSTKNFHVQS